MNDETAGAAAGALAGLRVLDLSRILAGPWCGQNLADLGADVIKIERPGQGDDTRTWGPPFARDGQGNETAQSAYFMTANRNKRSLALDISKPAGQSVVRRLAGRADILIENYKVGGLARYGLDYPSLEAGNPGLIYCSITGFGQDGPYASRPGYDFMIQATGGIMSVTGRPDGEPGAGPVKVGVAYADLMTGMYATVAVLAAVVERQRSGRGQYIDMALLDAQVAALANQASNYLISGRPPGRLGNGHPNIVPYEAFETADGHIIVAVGNDGQYRRFCEALDRADLADHPDYASNGARVINRKALLDIIRPLMREKDSRRWLERLERAGVPTGPINDIRQVFDDPQVVSRRMKVTLPHPVLGDVPMTASPMKFSRTPVSYRHPPPMLGEHGAGVLADWLACDDAEIEALRAAGVLGGP